MNKSHAIIAENAGVRRKRGRGMRVALENEFVSAEFESVGAELKSLKTKEDNREFMWQADPAYWARTSPVLFPVVGRLKEDSYRYRGKTYPMSQHGFARDSEFEIVRRTDSEIVFCLEAGEASRKIYPFEFVLEIGYRLEGETLTVIWNVANPSAFTLHFSIGGHPGFVCPLYAEEKREDYFLKFQGAGRSLERLLLKGAYAADETETFALGEDGVLALYSGIFDQDALVFENSQVNEITLLTPEKTPYLSVRFDAPLVGVWSMPGTDAPYVCIEPWYGRCDRESFCGEFEEREWTCHLEEGKAFRAEYQITLYPVGK